MLVVDVVDVVSRKQRWIERHENGEHDRFHILIRLRHVCSEIFSTLTERPIRPGQVVLATLMARC
jgi:hypothetical protein